MMSVPPLYAYPLRCCAMLFAGGVKQCQEPSDWSLTCGATTMTVSMTYVVNPVAVMTVADDSGLRSPRVPRDDIPCKRYSHKLREAAPQTFTLQAATSNVVSRVAQDGQDR